MIVNSGGVSTNNEVVINPNLIMNCDLQKGIVSTKDTYLSLEGGASKTGSGEFTKFWKYEYKTGTNDSCSASINWGTFIQLSSYNYSTSFNGESVEVTLPDGSTSWKYVHTLGTHYFEGAYISATGTVQNYYSCRGKVVTLSALLQGRVKVQLLGTDDVLIGELPEVSWEDRYNQVLKTAQFTVPADCTKLSVKVICEPSYRIYERDDIGNTNHDDDTNPSMSVNGLKLELGDAQTLCDADGKLLPQPQDTWEEGSLRNIAYAFNAQSPDNYAPKNGPVPEHYADGRAFAYNKKVNGSYNSDTGTYDTISMLGLMINPNGYSYCGSDFYVAGRGISICTSTGGGINRGGIVIGDGSTGIDGNDGSGGGSIVIGNGTATGSSIALCANVGYASDATAADQGVVIGLGSATGSRTLAMVGGQVIKPATTSYQAYGGVAIGHNAKVTGYGGTAISSGNTSEAIASGESAWVIGAGSATGVCSAVVGAGLNGGTASGNYSLVIAYGVNGGWVESQAANSIVVGNYCCIAAAEKQMVMGECNVTSTATTDKFIFGGGGTYQARKNCFRITTNSGTYAVGSYHSSGADYAEMFEWFDGNPDGEDRAGRFVVLNGDKIQFAQPDDEDILGIVSGNASVIGDVFDDAWQGQWMTDIFGRPIMEEVEEEYPVQLPDGTTETKSHTVIRQKLNPEWDPDMEYVPRGKRKEWDAVGLVGKLVAVDDGTCEVNGYATVSINGTATKAANRTPYRVMKRLDETHIQVFIK